MGHGVAFNLRLMKPYYFFSDNLSKTLLPPQPLCDPRSTLNHYNGSKEMDGGVGHKSSFKHTVSSQLIIMYTAKPWKWRNFEPSRKFCYLKAFQFLVSMDPVPPSFMLLACFLYNIDSDGDIKRDKKYDFEL